MKRHFLDLSNFDLSVLRSIIDDAKLRKSGELNDKPLDGKTLAMIFEKQSTRTRISFEVAMKKMGGDVIVLSPKDMLLSKGETLEDTAKVMSRYVDIVVIRSPDHEKVIAFSEAGSVPVVNGLTDYAHPCQILADMLTIEEKLGTVEGKVIAWCGDGNNMARDFVFASAKFGFEFRIATPPEYAMDDETIAWAHKAGARVITTNDPVEAVAGADVVMTDTWVSIGDSPAESDQRMKLLRPFTVTQDLMAHAGDSCLFMHCLPAYRGNEVEADVMDGVRSIVWDQAENRLHIQKSILAWCLEKL